MESNLKPKSKLKKKEMEYVPFKLFNEHGNWNWIKFYDSDKNPNTSTKTTRQKKRVLRQKV